VDAARWEVSRFWDDRRHEAAGLLKALTTGDRSGIDEEVREKFRRAGMAHLLAVSGLHLGGLAAMAYLVLLRLFASCEALAARTPAQPLAAAATIPLLFLFARFTGDQVSAVRASLMAALFLGGILLRRKSRPTTLISAAALLMLFADPALLASPSFQLSFAAATVLVVAGRKFWLPAGGGSQGSVLRRVPAYLAGVLRASVLVPLLTLPLTAFHFGSVSVTGPAANLMAVPLTVFAVLPLAWAAVPVILLAPAWAPAASAPALFAGKVLTVTAGFCAALPGGAVGLMRPAPALAAAMLVGGVFCLQRGRRFATAAAAVTLAVFMLPAVPGGGLLRGTVQAVFLDVGQGESTLFRLPGGSVMLVDAGPAWSSGDAGRYVVAPALRRMGVTGIDCLVISHDHPDHTGGLESILKEFPVGEIWKPKLAAAGEGSFGAVPVRYFSRGDVVRPAAGVTVRFLNPPKRPYAGPSGALNDNSLVFVVEGPFLEVLMTGDAGARPVAEMRPPEDCGKVRVVKVPHHGGAQKGTASLAESFRPQYAVISVGRNRYGHPDAATEKAWGEYARILRTDVEGAVFLQGGGPAGCRTWTGDSRGEGGMRRSLRWAFGLL
jgi:competence protein ComEC